MTNPSIFIINPEDRTSADVFFLETISKQDIVSVEPSNYKDLDVNEQYSLSYGYFSEGEDRFRVNLFSTPGSTAFTGILPQVLKTNLATSILGYIFMIDARAVSEFDYPKKYLPIFYDIVGKDTPHVIAVVNTDKPTAREIATLQHEYDIPKHVKLIKCDQRNRESVKNVLMEFISIVEITPISDKVKKAIETL